MTFANRYGDCLAVFVCASVAAGSTGCATDPKAVGLNGGDGGAEIDCAANLTGTDNLISDFETGFGTVLPNGGRNGAWYGYNDGTQTCIEDPAPGLVNAPATALESPRCGSTFAFRMTGSGCTTWGAGIGTDLAAPQLDGGAADAGVARKIPYDLSGFSAISFWGRVGAGSTTAVLFKVPMLADTKVADGGLCSLSEVGTDKCSDDWSRALKFTTSWKMFEIPLTDDAVNGLSPGGWGKRYPLNLADIIAIQFQVGLETTFDVWIDDVRLTPN